MLQSFCKGKRHASIDIAKQHETLSRLRDELASLNARFDESKKVAGLPDGEVTIDPSEITPELVRALDAAKSEAEKAGRNAVAALKAETEEPAASFIKRARSGRLSIC